MITNKLSQTIYNQLINGKAINKQAYLLKNNTLEDNSLYNEIFNNFDEYNDLYQKINYELLHKNSCFFYIREIGGEDANEVTIKIQALLIIIGRIITEQGYLFDVLTDYRAGVKVDDLALATSEERYLDILHTCKLCLKRGIEEEINNNLVARGLMFINSRGHYVLTGAGASFFEEIVDVSSKNMAIIKK